MELGDQAEPMMRQTHIVEPILSSGESGELSHRRLEPFFSATFFQPSGRIG